MIFYHESKVQQIVRSAVGERFYVSINIHMLMNHRPDAHTDQDGI